MFNAVLIIEISKGCKKPKGSFSRIRIFYGSFSAKIRSLKHLRQEKHLAVFFHKIKSLCPEYVAWAISFIIKQTAGGLLPLRKICKYAVQCIWELLFLRMAGCNDYNANGAIWYLSAMLPVPLTCFAKILLSLVETGCYLFAQYWTFWHAISKMQFVILLLFAVSVMIRFN